MYANDLIIMEVTTINLNCLQLKLNHFLKDTRLKLNTNKSSICFSKNVPHDIMIATFEHLKLMELFTYMGILISTK